MLSSRNRKLITALCVIKLCDGEKCQYQFNFIELFSFISCQSLFSGIKTIFIFFSKSWRGYFIGYNTENRLFARMPTIWFIFLEFMIKWFFHLRFRNFIHCKYYHGSLLRKIRATSCDLLDGYLFQMNFIFTPYCWRFYRFFSSSFFSLSFPFILLTKNFFSLHIITALILLPVVS